jgi:hypothetical protein
VSGFAWGDAAGAMVDERRKQRTEAGDLEKQLADIAYRQALIKQQEAEGQRATERLGFDRERFKFDQGQAERKESDARNQRGLELMAGDVADQYPNEPRKLVGALIRAGKNPPSELLPQASDPFTLGPGQVRFDPTGKQVATGPPQREAQGPQAPVRVETMENGKRVVKFMHPSQVMGQTFDDQPPATQDRPPTQGEFTAAGYAARQAQAEPTLRAVEKAIVGMNPAMFEVQRRLPPAMQSKEMQNYMQAARNYINAQLRRESGAVISDSEFSEARAQYLPYPGDDDSTKVLKHANRRQNYENNRRASRNAYEGQDWPSDGGGGAHTVGETKTFPNGRTGRWDGRGWVPIQ